MSLEKTRKTKPHLLSALSSPITLLYFFLSQTSVSLIYCFSNLCAHTFPSVYLWSIRCGCPKQCHGCERHRESWRFIREAASPARNREQMLRNRATVSLRWRSAAFLFCLFSLELVVSFDPQAAELAPALQTDGVIDVKEAIQGAIQGENGEVVQIVSSVAT